MIQRGPLRFKVLLYLIFYSVAGLAVVSGAVALHRARFGDRAKGRPRCPRCWHDMTGSRGFVCPECGNDAVRQANLYRTRLKGMEAILGALLIVSGAALAAIPTVQDQGWTALVPTTALMIVMPWTDNHWVFDEVDARVNGAYPEWFSRRRPTGDVSAYGRFFAHRCAAVIENSADRTLRLRAVQLLFDMRVRDDQSERALLVATSDVDPTIRNEALNALTRVAAVNSIIDPGRCARRVAECLADSRVAVRTRAARFFDYLPPHLDALPALIEALSDERAEVRAEVCGVLANFGPAAESALPALSSLIDDRSDAVSSSAMLAIGSLGYVAAPAVDNLITASALEGRRGNAALRAIARLGPAASAATPLLANMLMDQSLPDYRRELALASLFEISPYDPPVFDALERGATCNLETVRWRIASELGRFHADDPRQVRLLLGLLGDVSAQVRMAGAYSLGRMGEVREEELVQLRHLAADTDFIGWEQAQSALNRILEDRPAPDADAPVAASRR